MLSESMVHEADVFGRPKCVFSVSVCQPNPENEQQGEGSIYICLVSQRSMPQKLLMLRNETLTENLQADNAFYSKGSNMLNTYCIHLIYTLFRQLSVERKQKKPKHVFTCKWLSNSFCKCTSRPVKNDQIHIIFIQKSVRFHFD